MSFFLILSAGLSVSAAIVSTLAIFTPHYKTQRLEDFVSGVQECLEFAKMPVVKESIIKASMIPNIQPVPLPFMPPKLTEKEEIVREEFFKLDPELGRSEIRIVKLKDRDKLPIELEQENPEKTFMEGDQIVYVFRFRGLRRIR